MKLSRRKQSWGRASGFASLAIVSLAFALQPTLLLGCSVGQSMIIDVSDADREIVFIAVFDEQGLLHPSDGSGVIDGKIVFGPNPANQPRSRGKIGVLRLDAASLVDRFGWVPFDEITGARVVGRELSNGRHRLVELQEHPLQVLQTDGETVELRTSVLGDVVVELAVRPCSAPTVSVVANGAPMIVGTNDLLWDVYPTESEVILRTNAHLVLTSSDSPTGFDDPRRTIVTASLPGIRGRAFIGFSHRGDSASGFLASSLRPLRSHGPSFIQEIENGPGSLRSTFTATLEYANIAGVETNEFAQTRIVSGTGEFGSYDAGVGFNLLFRFDTDTDDVDEFRGLAPTHDGRWLVFANGRFYFGSGSESLGWRTFVLSNETLSFPRIRVSTVDSAKPNILWLGGNDGELYAFNSEEESLTAISLTIPSNFPCSGAAGLATPLVDIVSSSDKLLLFFEGCASVLVFEPSTSCSTSFSLPPPPPSSGISLHLPLLGVRKGDGHILIFDRSAHFFEAAFQ